jgi:outer membrane protein assembly factor BamB
MDASSIMLLATKGTVVAFHRTTGEKLWQTVLNSGWTSGDFVSLVADERSVFAHSKGTIYCLDLSTGAKQWEDGLAGLGYNLASLALPGSAQAMTAGMAEHRARQQQAANSANQTQTHGTH